MFGKARLKLTAWYLLIIMLISIGFSAVIYKMLTVELDGTYPLTTSKYSVIVDSAW